MGVASSCKHDALLQRRPNLFLLGRHLVSRTAVDDGHAPAPERRAERAASMAVLPPPTTMTLPVEPRSGSEIEALEEGRGRDDAIPLLLTRDIESLAALGADRQQNRFELLSQVRTTRRHDQARC